MGSEVGGHETPPAGEKKKFSPPLDRPRPAVRLRGKGKPAGAAGEKKKFSAPLDSPPNGG